MCVSYGEKPIKLVANSLPFVSLQPYLCRRRFLRIQPLLTFLLVREAFPVRGEPGEGIIEQIDGVVEINGDLYLVEMKWWNQPIDRQEISPHLVSVYHRGNGGGIVISYSGFSPAAIAEVKTALVQKVVALVELQEIVRALDQDWNLKTLLVEKIQHSQMHKEPPYKKVFY